MFNQMEIFTRIKELLNLKKEKDLASFLEISPQYLAEIKKRGTIPYEKIIQKSIGNYNLEYIFFGRGRSEPPKFELDESKEIDYEFLSLVELYSTPKLKEEYKNKLLEIKKLTD